MRELKKYLSCVPRAIDAREESEEGVYLSFYQNPKDVTTMCLLAAFEGGYAFPDALLDDYTECRNQYDEQVATHSALGFLIYSKQCGFFEKCVTFFEGWMNLLDLRQRCFKSEAEAIAWLNDGVNEKYFVKFACYSDNSGELVSNYGRLISMVLNCAYSTNGRIAYTGSLHDYTLLQILMQKMPEDWAYKDVKEILSRFLMSTSGCDEDFAQDYIFSSVIRKYFIGGDAYGDS